VGVAWPYANGSLHLGHIAGAYLPADVFARYHRIKGNKVLMVSGSDQHGTPITLRAEQEGKDPQEIAAKYHQEFLDCWDRLGITFDLFTTTGTPNHTRVVHDIFLTLLQKDYVYRGTVPLSYCSNCHRYLPDRYVEGTCPHCGSAGARGDQCDACGKSLDPPDLGDPRCKVCGNAAEFRSSEHFFLKLSAFRDDLLAWVNQQTHWRQNVQNFTARFLEEGLKDRAITRDIEWGVRVPDPEFDNKRIYVWFEAVIGYLSASQEWAMVNGDENGWRLFWEEGVRSYYFIGKDNIPFHTIVWPAMLMGYGGLALPYDVPANEFLTLDGKQLSTSRNWAVWLPDYLERYDPDQLRYVLSASMPETSDTDFSWQEFVRRNNDELVATYGNLVHRTLSFTYRNFEGQVPAYGDLDDVSQALLGEAKAAFDVVGSCIADCSFREGIKTSMSLAQKANRYLEEKSPWKAIKEDRKSAATALYASLSVISCLRILLYPFLPFSSQKLHEMLGFEGKVEESPWRFEPLRAGQKMLSPTPLFAKLDEQVVEEETSRLDSGAR
jgi:methionyl-tRNA synthetase